MMPLSYGFKDKARNLTIYTHRCTMLCIRSLMEIPKKHVKRLSVNIPIDIWNLIYEKADFRNITISKWVIRALVEKIKNENKHL